MRLLWIALLLPLNLWANPQALTLRSEGAVYYAGFIKVYDAKLYSTENAPLAQIFSSDQPLCLSLIYDVSVTREQFIEAGETVLEDQIGEDGLTAIQQPLETLHAAYQNVEAGDEYRLCRDHESFRLSLNGEPVMALNDREFGQTYLGMWLAEDGISRSLRKDLLGLE